MFGLVRQVTENSIVEEGKATVRIWRGEMLEEERLEAKSK
jgi:hypothetical protein